jgi:hypothetical protein
MHLKRRINHHPRQIIKFLVRFPHKICFAFLGALGVLAVKALNQLFRRDMNTSRSNK